MKYFFILPCILTLPFLAQASEKRTRQPTAPVTGFARSLGTAKPLKRAEITILESGEEILTDRRGRFGPIHWPVGQPITLELKKFGFRHTQTATVLVPPEGLTSSYNNLTFQVPDVLTFKIFTRILKVKLDKTKCHLAATVSAYRKTMDDLPQGEAHAQVFLTPNPTQHKPYYFDIFKEGPFRNYPNPFPRGLTETSEDGGVVFVNLEPQEKPYTLKAIKSGINFSQAQFLCRPGAFINLSPPLGPSVQDM